MLYDFSTWPHFKRLYFLKDQFPSHASSEDIPPKQNRILRDDQTETRDEESSQFSELDGASVDILDIKIETSESLNSDLQQATSSIDARTTKHGAKRPHHQDTVSTSSENEKQKLKTSDEEEKTRDEDASFFESLIPHIKGLPPSRKMLLRMKIQELIYNFVYKQEF
jgi:hypothetical protein